MRYRSLLLAVALAALLLVTTGLGFLVRSEAASFARAELDRPIIEEVATWRTGGLNDVMLVATDLGGSLFVALALAAALGFALYRRSLPLITYVLVVYPGALGSSRLVKSLVDRPRPNLDPLVEVSGSSWVSGHATASAVCFFALAAIGAQVMPRMRWPLYGAATIAAGLVAFTRVYLGVHWPFDALGGLLFGAAWALIAARFLLAREEAPGRG